MKRLALYSSLIFTALNFSSLSVDICRANEANTVTNSEINWSELAIKDVEAAYQLSVINHPGMHDVRNPGFVKQLEKAKQEGLKLAVKAHSSQGFSAAIARFRTILQDGHAGAVDTLPSELKPQRSWPGFSTVWRGDALKVYYSELDTVAKGDKLVSCDNKAIDTLLVERVFRYYGEVEQPGSWWNHGWRLAIDDGNPFLSPLERCTFEKADGSAYSLKLNWRIRPDTVSENLKNAYNGDKLPIELNWPLEDIAWISMPTFAPNEQQQADYQAMLSAIEQQHDKLMQAKAVVLDLRHNQGGSSMWSEQIASALWGSEQFKYGRYELHKNTQVWWRTSKGNTDYLGDVVASYDKASPWYQWLKTTHESMQAAYEKGEHYYVEIPAAERQAMPKNASKFTTPVYVIVPGQCASACLDALDSFKLFANTQLVGAPSSTDSTYMEVRLETLPSGFAKVILPIKVYVNRPREKGFYYQPDIKFNELEWTTQALVKMIAEL